MRVANKYLNSSSSGRSGQYKAGECYGYEQKALHEPEHQLMGESGTKELPFASEGSSRSGPALETTVVIYMLDSWLPVFGGGSSRGTLPIRSLL